MSASLMIFWAKGKDNSPYGHWQWKKEGLRERIWLECLKSFPGGYG
jgi:hypothetical protein